MNMHNRMLVKVTEEETEQRDLEKMMENGNKRPIQMKGAKDDSREQIN